MSEDVQHGLRSWVDYGRPWILRRFSDTIWIIPSFRKDILMIQILGRQFLVSQYHASIYSNLVAIALTLAGPRLWTLLKALFFYAIDIYKRYSNRRDRLPIHVDLQLISRPPPLPSERGNSAGLQQSRSLQNERAHSTQFEHDRLDATNTSHSELGAAIMLIGNIWRFLRSGRIELPSNSMYRKKLLSRFPTISRIWRNFLQRPFDILVSLLLSSFFVAIFVAESTANVLSVNIVSDTTAIVSSPKCNLKYLFHSDSDAADYRQKMLWSQTRGRWL